MHKQVLKTYLNLLFRVIRSNKRSAMAGKKHSSDFSGTRLNFSVKPSFLFAKAYLQ